MDAQQLQEQCRQLIPQILANRGWKLIQDETAFVEEVIQEVQNRLDRMESTSNRQLTLEKIIQRATINRYNHHWYVACRANGTLQQRIAFTELYRYIYSIACYRTRPNDFLAEESAQTAWVNVWRGLDQIKDPGAFMGYAKMVVIHEINRLMKKFGKQAEEEINQIDLVNYEEDTPQTATTTPASRPSVSPPPDQTPSPLTEAEQTSIETIIRNCLKRSKDRQTVIIGRFLQEKSVEELVNELGLSPRKIHVLTYKALGVLRKCAEFLQLVERLSWRLTLET